MDNEFAEAVGEVIREEVVRGNEVEIRGLGVFRLEHRNQHQKQFDDGRVVMMPPQDRIAFIPDKPQVYEN